MTVIGGPALCLVEATDLATSVTTVISRACCAAAARCTSPVRV